MSAEVLPCPFCGGTDIRFTNHGKVSRRQGHREDDVWSTCCLGCGATFPNRYSKALLVACWNRRPQNDAVAAALWEYHHALDTRQHGDVAADRMIKAVEAALGKPWKQGATLNPPPENLIAESQPTDKPPTL